VKRREEGKEREKRKKAKKVAGMKGTGKAGRRKSLSPLYTIDVSRPSFNKPNPKPQDISELIFLILCRFAGL